MRVRHLLSLLITSALLSACGGGGSGTSGSFQLVQFLESGKDGIPRNRILTFVFSAPVSGIQDFAERLKVENIQSGVGTSNFARAIGTYVASGNQITFTPRLPEKADRSDAGFRSKGSYHVFLKAGPDSLRSTSGDTLATPQEFVFDTSDFFEDPIPSEPPRALSLIARDTTTGVALPLSRLVPKPGDLALIPNTELISGSRIIEPGTGPRFSVPWQFELAVSEPVDPASVTPESIKMFEVRNNALDTADTALPGQFGDSVEFAVPINVTTIQRPNASGVLEFLIRVTPVQTLVDDARYRIIFSGEILGLDFRKTFIGDNGLTGDGASSLSQTAGGTPFPEPGGLGYTSEFLVYDRPAIEAERLLDYKPLEDGIEPETGQTTTNPALYNTALYNPAIKEGSAVGFLSAFGNGNDGPLAASGGNTVIVDTGDTANPPVGNPFNVQDLNPNDNYLIDTRPGSPVPWDTPEPFELNLSALTVSTSSTLRFIGKNPVVLRVAGIVQISGTLDLDGTNGANGGGGTAAAGIGAAGGFDGGRSRQGVNTCSYRSTSCTDFVSYLNGCAPASAGFPFSVNGTGPGRGFAGGEAYVYYATDNKSTGTATGGGGGSHATVGAAGDDVVNAAGAPGTPGPSCSTFTNVRNAGVIGVRGQPGAVYGDAAVSDVLLGGSGGGAGGAAHTYNFGTAQQAGGAGGGGGGSVTIIASGKIIANAGRINANGGAGGAGAVRLSSSGGSFAWDSVSGGGGGGAGGTISLISGDDIELTAALLSSLGGAGGAKGVPTAGSCNGCNGGGAGGNGYVFLMDADGIITGLANGNPGTYPGHSSGYLTISQFSTDRFSSVSAITELFAMTAADPEYLSIRDGDIEGTLFPGQTITISMSSTRSDPAAPLNPDSSLEIGAVPVATITSVNGGEVVTTVPGAMDLLNPDVGGPARDAFVRVIAVFEYGNPVEAALGPLASMNKVIVNYRFNG